jgi:hypothetical protein
MLGDSCDPIAANPPRFLWITDVYIAQFLSNPLAAVLADGDHHRHICQPSILLRPEAWENKACREKNGKSQVLVLAMLMMDDSMRTSPKGKSVVKNSEHYISNGAPMEMAEEIVE